MNAAAHVPAATEAACEGAGGPSGSGTQVHKHFTRLDKLLLEEWKVALPVRCCRACLQREAWDTPGDVERMEHDEIDAGLGA